MRLFLLIFSIICTKFSYAKAFSVGDYIEYDVFSGETLDQKVNKEILEYREEFEDFKIRSVRHFNGSAPIVTDNFMSRFDLESESLSEQECLKEGGQKVKSTVGTRDVNGCKIIYDNGEYVIYSDEVPFYFVESLGPSILGKPIFKKVRNFKFGY